jgi:hypothetical protein
LETSQSLEMSFNQGLHHPLQNERANLTRTRQYRSGSGGLSSFLVVSNLVSPAGADPAFHR